MATTPAHALHFDAAPEASAFFFGNVLGQGSYAKDPDERIGAQQNEEGYAELKNHPFFEGVEWDSINDKTPPYNPPKLDLPEPKLDGASENWTVAEYFSDDFSESTTDEFRYYCFA
ncbi:DNA helicase MCM8 [Phytophthora nicotianae]|uniref:DNA helicase MCM8 n=1 Tax=Phytophthora nicotianae TaxID=4792 RepID=A0A0W8CN41_PHYNI|nr:DNA helicase MCM8 [Phytophthora nicotianae]